MTAYCDSCKEPLADEMLLAIHLVAGHSIRTPDAEARSRKPEAGIRGDAKFSACGRWRWWLTRVWDASLPVCCLIGMNPSTADANNNDPTVAKEIHFVRSWGFGGLLKLNAYAYKATKPADLYAARARGMNVIGELNTESHMAQYLEQFKVRKVVACWGKLKTDRGWILGRRLTERGLKLDCFRENKDGSPAHPLYLPYGLLPEPWNY